MNLARNSISSTPLALRKKCVQQTVKQLVCIPHVNFSRRFSLSIIPVVVLVVKPMSIVMTKHGLFVTGVRRLAWSATTLGRAVSQRSSHIYSLQLHYEWWSAEKLTTGEKPNPKHLSGRSCGQGINDK